MEQGSQHGAEPLRAIGQYVADVSPRNAGARDDMSEDWLTTNPMNASSNNRPLDEGEKGGPQDSNGPQPARGGRSSSTGQSPLSHSDNQALTARPSRESRDTRDSTTRGSKTSNRSSGSRASRGSWGSPPSSGRRPSADGPTALGDLVEYGLGDEYGLRDQTYLTEQMALQQQRSPGRRPQYPQANYSPSRPVVDQPSVRSPSHRQEMQDKRPSDQRTSQEQRKSVPEPAGAAPGQQATPVTPVGNVSAPPDEAKGPTEAARPRRRRNRSPLRVMSADEAPAVAKGEGGGEGGLGNERKSDGDAWASSSQREVYKSRRQRVRELDRGYHRDSSMAGGDSAGSDGRSTDVEDEEGWGRWSEAGGLREARVTSSHRRRRTND